MKLPERWKKVNEQNGKYIYTYILKWIEGKFHWFLREQDKKRSVPFFTEKRVDMVEFGYHGKWYTLLIINIIDWNDLEKFVYSSWYIRG